MLHRSLVIAGMSCVVLLADTVVLRSGKTVEGAYLGGDSRRIRMAVGDDVQSFGIDEISQIRFGNATEANASKPGAAKTKALKSAPTTELSSQSASASKRSEVPAGTALVVRMIDDVDSSRDKAG